MKKTNLFWAMPMGERNMFAWVLGTTLLVLAITLFVIPAPKPEGPVYLPWSITRVEGTIRVFGITLEHTPIGDLEQRFGDPAEISLFKTTGRPISVEAYFDSITISGIKAKLVVSADLTDAEKEAMYNRGARVATLGSGTRKVTLSDADLALVRRTPVASLTYLPSTNLSPELIARRFGEPQRRIPEPEGNTVHWLYPDRGLDIAVDPKGKDILQYVPPERFDSVVGPLEKALAGKQEAK